MSFALIGFSVVATLAALAQVVILTRARTSRSSKRIRSRVVIEYRDAFGTGEWCTFDRALSAYEAVEALNAVYAGQKTFWVNEATVVTGSDYLGTASLPAPIPTPKPVTPHARPKPGTPVVRQLNGRWYVQTGRFEIGYGSGEAGYRAALAAVERFHKS